MFFDDRLATVLRQRSDSDGGARTQFRQLLDILGNRKYGQDQTLIAAAWLRMDSLAKVIPARERAAAIRERGWRFRNADLAAHLSDFEPEVASAALNRADLSADDWSALIPRLPVRARGFLRLRDDLPIDAETLLDRLGVRDRGLPRPDEQAYASSASAEYEEPVPEPFPNEPAIQVAKVEAPPPSFERPSSDEFARYQPGDEEPYELDIEAAPESETARSEISALVERIAQFRRNRDDEADPVDNAPRLPLGEETRPADRSLSGFGFAADAEGRIEWAETEAAPMVIGKRLAQPQAFGQVAKSTPIERAFRYRQPIAHAAMSLKGASAIAGDWIVDAHPRFTDEGNFSGYVGRFRRPYSAQGIAANDASEADKIRQLLHELRTPVTAVQGYAEVIQQQLFGPAPHEYRALAAAIAADAARILAGFEELDRLAKLETGAADIALGETDLGALVERMTGQLALVMGPRNAGIELQSRTTPPIIVAIDPNEAEALVWRVLATLSTSCAADEVLPCVLRRDDGLARLICTLPEQLAAEDDIFAAEVRPVTGTVNAGLFGAGFTLRLARAEARAAGGGLTYEDAHLSLSLPLLTDNQTLPSQDEDDGMAIRSGGEA